MIISRNNLRSLYVKQNKHFVDLQYNEWNKNVRNGKILLDNMRFKKLECGTIQEITLWCDLRN